MHEEDLDRFLTERAWLFELSLDPMVVGRFDGSLRVVNGAFQRLVGMELHEVLERPFLEFLHPDDAEVAKAHLDRLAAGESLRDCPLRIRRHGGDDDDGGEDRWISWTITPSPAEDAFYAVGRDITERRRAEEQLAAQARELARSNADLEQFAYVVSHDLSQPLRVICSYAELLMGHYGAPLTRDGKELVAHIHTGGRHMQKLTADLLAYCRVGQGQLHREMVDCNRLVADVLENVGATLGDTEVVVADLPAVYADPTQLAQVFQNLIVNAVRFSRPGSRPYVDIDAYEREDFCEICVADRGIGIPPERRKRIFELFERVERGANELGTGIGLAICARVTDRHGGHIWVEDAPGGGSRFCFTLPRR